MFRLLAADSCRSIQNFQNYQRSIVLPQGPGLTQLTDNALKCNVDSGSIRDDTNHGTCMADLVTGRSNGATGKARLIPVKAFDKSCWPSFDGWNWIADQIINDFENDRDAGFGIINLSLGKPLQCYCPS